MVSNGSIDYALQAGRKKGLYRRIALLWRAILIDHPFTDINKRTTLHVTILSLKRDGLNVGEEQKEKITMEILKVAQKNINSIQSIERRIRYAVEGD